MKLLLVIVALLASALTIGCAPLITISEHPCTHDGICPFGDLPLVRSGQGWIESSTEMLGGFYYWDYGPMGMRQEIVLPPNYLPTVRLHEECHAQQGDEYKWPDTNMGKAFPRTVAPARFDLYFYGPSDLLVEDAANTCAYYQFDPDWLKQTSPERYDWAAKWIGGN